MGAAFFARRHAESHPRPFPPDYCIGIPPMNSTEALVTTKRDVFAAALLVLKRGDVTLREDRDEQGKYIDMALTQWYELDADELRANTLTNRSFRSVAQTVANVQVVYYALRPTQKIPMETHDETTQILGVEQGRAVVTWIDSDDGDGATMEQQVVLQKGDWHVIPPQTTHVIANADRHETLKMWSLYSPPGH